MQAVCFLQGLYGFVVRDFNYEGMQAYRDLARSAVILAISAVRSGGVLCNVADAGYVGPVVEPASCQLLCNRLISSVCDM